MRAPWSTPADRAEQAVRARALVAWDFAHREAGCDTCERMGYCPERRRRIQELVDWCARRSEQSLADELRRLENLTLRQAAP